MSESEISNFFAHQTVFLTGGTGFLGKLLVEKLLRVCNIKTLYIMVRSKKGKSLENRIADYFNYPCFGRIKDEKVEIKEKVVFIMGNCNEPNLGISSEIEEQLLKETNIVIHAAANVKFDLPLRFAAMINIRSTMDLLNLAKKMIQLKAFVYISTAFSNCPHARIDEKCYTPPMTHKQLFSILDGVPDDAILNSITPELLKMWPNTYTFTKSIAEYCINSEGKGLPTCIIRPPIITSTAGEPMPGWIDNYYGVVGITTAMSLGIMKSLNADGNAIAQIMPCDFVVNNILAATWNTANEKSSETIFYNCNISGSNSISWESCVQIFKNCYEDIPTVKAIWHYNAFKLRKNLTIHKLNAFFLHTLVAYIVDFLLICIRRKPLAVNFYKKMDESIDLFSYFTTKDWIFVSNNSENLWKKMNAIDKQLFNFNMTAFNYKSYCKVYVLGIRLYLLEDPIETIPQANRKLKLLKFAHNTTKALFYFLLLLLFYYFL